MAEILYNDTPVSNVSVYDPSAGSGTLLLALANKIELIDVLSIRRIFHRNLHSS